MKRGTPHQWMRLDESFSYVVSDLSYPSLCLDKWTCCVSAQDIQSSCNGKGLPLTPDILRTVHQAAFGV